MTKKQKIKRGNKQELKIEKPERKAPKRGVLG